MSAFDKWVKRSGGGPAAAANRETQMNRQPQRVQRFQVPKREARESFNGWVSRTGGGPAAAKNISTSGYVSPILQRAGAHCRKQSENTAMAAKQSSMHMPIVTPGFLRADYPGMRMIPCQKQDSAIRQRCSRDHSRHEYR